MNANVLYAVVGGFTLGVFVSSLASIPPAVSLFGMLLGAAMVVLVFLSSKRPAAALLIAVAVLSFGLGALRFALKDAHTEVPIVVSALDTTISAEGVVVDEPAQKAVSQQLIVRLDTLRGSALSEKVIVQTDRFPEFSYGDRVSITGKLVRPEAFATDSGRMFDYPAYLAKDGIYYQVHFAKVSLIRHGAGNPILGALFLLKHAFLNRIGALIPEPESALAGGLLLGGKQSLSSDLQNTFRTAGIVHIIVLSGYNITIVADAVMKSLSFVLPQTLSFAGGAFAIMLFALMTGASATVVRASAMALLAVLARSTGRTYAIGRALLVAGFFMLLQNPKILVFDPSFQLSFLATAGLIVGVPLLEKYFLWVPERFGLREVVLATLSTQFAVLPLLLYQTGQLSIVALPVNLLVLPFIPVAMFLSFATGLVGFITMLGALPLAFLAYLPLTYVIRVAEFSASIPYAAVFVPQIGGGVLILSYVLGAVGVVWLTRRNRKNTTEAVVTSLQK